MNERSFWVRAAIIMIAIAAGVFLVQAVGRLWGFMGDLIMIIFFSWLVGSVLIHFVNALMRMPYMKRPVAVFLVYLALILLVADFVVLVLPAAVNQLLELQDNLPNLIARIPEWLEAMDRFMARRGIDGLNLANRYQTDFSIDDLLSDSANWAADNAIRITQTVLSAAFNIAMVIVLSFYVVLDGGRRLNEALTVLPRRVEEEVRLVLRTFDEIFQGYVRGMLLVSLIYGVGVAIVMMATDLPAALPSAIIASLLLAVPFVGDWLALGLPLIVAALAGDFVTFFIVLITLLFIQQVMLNILTPRILGHAVRMPAGLVLLAVLVGAQLAGIPGALLGVPAGAVIYSLAIVYGNRVRARRENRERVSAEQQELAQEAEAADASGHLPDSPQDEIGDAGPSSEGPEGREPNSEASSMPADAQDEPSPEATDPAASDDAPPSPTAG